MCVDDSPRRISGPTLRWLGHATVMLVDRGTAVLTDPLLTARVAHLRRRRGPVPVLSAVDNPDVVLLSHLHADHTHLPSLRLLSQRVPIVVPAGAPDALPELRKVGSRLIEVRAGDQVAIGGLSILAVPADHDGRRWRHGPRNIPALGYVIEGDQRTYFAGDTDFYPDMAQWVSAIDLALLPVAGWGPTLGAGHMDPPKAVRAAEAVSARLAVPIHFGTLWPIGMGRVRSSLFHDPGAEFVRLATIAGLQATEMVPGSMIDL
ncbi:membrane protein [Williamsia sp. D3]|nr:membrane protein [Williamsia sp. D3]